MKPLMKLLTGITLGILLGASVDAAVGTFTFKTPGASDTVEAVSLVYPQRVPEAGSVSTSSIADGSVTPAKLSGPIPVANGGTGATTAAAGLAALGGASLNGSSTVGFAADNLVLGASGAGADSTLVRQNTYGRFSTTDATQFVLNCFTATTNNLANPFSQTTGESSKSWYYGLYGQTAYYNDARFIIMNAGVPKLSITRDGQVLVATSTADGINKLQVNGSMRLIGMAAPTPTEGGIYFNSSDKHLYVYNGTSWVQLDN